MLVQDLNDSSRISIEPDAIIRTNALLAQAARARTFTGAVLIAHNGRILLNEGYGFSDRARGIPNTPQTRFHLGSITKQFTAMAILLLQGQGKLSVNDPICKFFSSCPAEWHGVTIHHLLTHTSGLSGRMSSRLYEEIESAVSGPVPPSEKNRYLGLNCDWSLDTLPGKQYSYNNFGYILLSHIVELVSAQSYTDFLAQAIFIPLGMRNTGYQDNSSGVAMLYFDHNDITGAEFGSPPVSEGSGHLYSTSEDLFLWDQALYSDRLLPQAELNRIFEPFVRETEFPGFGYGYGWFVGNVQNRPIVAGAGGGPMFATLIVRYPQDRLTVIVLTNQGNINHFSILAAISNELFKGE